ncbi:MAG: FHIPEP family type III secretion protein, partial [Nannocystaceae bacterium]
MQHSGPRTPTSEALWRLAGPLPRYLPALGVVALLACMLVPLPTALVDLLLSLSLSLALLLLVACLGIRRSAEFLAFPTLLLFTTLARLALNVQTTRLILSKANAGAVIGAFAELVTAGDIIVGAVIFAIITAVQYLVIARGAERVAEVAARFALDGLPGQQAAIDADLRGGTISAVEAGRRRAALVERSRFYGAMDGAIRFIKGDAIAGLAITAINLVGGVTVGMLGREGAPGLSFEQSLETYGKLTIGDGLVSQIPALLVALAAGVLVARVDREGRGDGEGRASALAWVNPTMLLIPAVLLLSLALVPGMPWAAFGATALGLVVAGMWLAAGPGEPAGPPPRRIVVGLGDPELARASSLRRALVELRGRSAAALGVEVPEIVAAPLAGAAPETLELALGERAFGRRALAGASENDVVVEVFRLLMAHADELIDLHDLEVALEALRSERPAVVREALRVRALPDLLGL